LSLFREYRELVRRNFCFRMSTLADMLSFAHLEAGYHPVVIKSKSVEGRDRFKQNTQRIFYFDDFLGETFLGNRSRWLELADIAFDFDKARHEQDEIKTGIQPSVEKYKRITRKLK